MTALLIAGGVLAAMSIDAGRPDIASWVVPVLVAVLLLGIGGARTDALLRELLYPTHTPLP